MKTMTADMQTSMRRRTPDLSDPRRIVAGVLSALQPGRLIDSLEIAAHLTTLGVRTGGLGERYTQDVVRASISALRGNGHAIETVRGWRCEAVAVDYTPGRDAILDVFAGNVGRILGIDDLREAFGVNRDPMRIAGYVDNHTSGRCNIEIRSMTRWRLVPEDIETVRVVGGLVLSGNASDLDVSTAYALLDRGGVGDHAGPIGPVVAAAVERGIVQEDLGREWLEASIEGAR